MMPNTATLPSMLWTAQRFASLSLAWQFLLAGIVVLVLAMTVLSVFVSTRIADGAVRRAAADAALHVDSFIAPLAMRLVDPGTGDETAAAELEALLRRNVASTRIFAFKLWRPDGSLAFEMGSQRAPAPAGAGPMSDSLRAAFAGVLRTELDDLSHDENEPERTAGVPLLEIYSPVRDPVSGRVAAVAEFYERADTLLAELAKERRRSRAVVAAVTTATIALLFLIVFRGSNEIVRQRLALRERIAELAILLTQNDALTAKIAEHPAEARRARRSHLDRLATDLHDGALQLLTLAALRLDILSRRLPQDDAAARDIAALREAILGSVAELRTLCSGLSLADIQGMTLSAMLVRLVAGHQSRTGHSVRLDLPADLPALGHDALVCAHRFTGEALSNASRHAAGRSLAVAVAMTDAGLSVTVSDAGPGIDEGRRPGFGLTGLHERLAALGGRVTIETRRGSGTRITMHLPQGRLR